MARSVAPRRRYGDRRDDAAGKGEVSPSLTVDARDAGVEVMIYYAVSLRGGHGERLECSDVVTWAARVHDVFAFGSELCAVPRRAGESGRSEERRNGARRILHATPCRGVDCETSREGDGTLGATYRMR